MSRIKLKQGDDEQRIVEIRQENPDGELVPFDLTHIARADLHAKVNNQMVLRLSTVNERIQWLNRSQGELLLDFHRSLTENAVWQQADYDLQLIDQQGHRKTVLSGRIELSQDITRVE